MQRGFPARHGSTVSEGLVGIVPGGISADDFAETTGLGDTLSGQLLDWVLGLEIGRREGGQYFFEAGDRLRAAMALLEAGIPLDAVSGGVGWRDFEGMTAEMLASMGFSVVRNLVMTKPRMEIDVVGVRLDVAMLIDCKHWGRTARSALAVAVRKQIARARQYVLKTDVEAAVPVLVTLHQGAVDFIDGVPIVPVFQFSSFVDEFHGRLDQMRTITA